MREPMTDFTREWIASRTDLIDMFSKPFRGMPQDSVGLSIMATNDFPRALAALKAVLEQEGPRAIGQYDDWSKGYHDALDACRDAIEAALRGES